MLVMTRTWLVETSYTGRQSTENDKSTPYCPCRHTGGFQKKKKTSLTLMLFVVLVASSVKKEPPPFVRSRPSKPNQRKADSQARFANLGCFCEFGVFLLKKKARRIRKNKNQIRARTALIFVNSPFFFRGKNTPSSQKHPKFANRLANRPFFGLVCQGDSWFWSPLLQPFDWWVVGGCAPGSAYWHMPSDQTINFFMYVGCTRKGSYTLKRAYAWQCCKLVFLQGTVHIFGSNLVIFDTKWLWHQFATLYLLRTPTLWHKIITYRKLFWNNYFWKITNFTRNFEKKSFLPGDLESAKSLQNYEK